MKRDTHLDAKRLARLAQGEGAMSASEAAHLAGCPDCRALVAFIDPTLILAPLGALPIADPPPARPPLTALPARGPRRARVTRRGAALAAAAAGLATLALLAPPPDAPERAGAEIVRGEARPGYSDVVRRIESDTAVVLTLLPDEPGGVPVTFIIDEELDL